MSASRITTLVRGDGAKARVTIDQAGQTLAVVDMDVEAVDEAIIALGNARAELRPPIRLNLEILDEIGALVDPAWRVQGQTVRGLRILSFRHPGYGWLGFGIPQAEANEIATWLTKDLPSDAPA